MANDFTMELSCLKPMMLQQKKFLTFMIDVANK